jgi:hypothetical protein
MQNLPFVRQVANAGDVKHIGQTSLKPTQKSQTGSSTSISQSTDVGTFLPEARPSRP